MSITIRIAVTLLLLLSALSVTAASRRQAIFVSDLHVGAGRTPTGEWRRIEDFRWQREFDQFLDFIEKKSSNNTDLVFVGDVFELWQSPTMACSDDVAKPGCIINDCMESSADLGCSEAEALERLKYVLAQHPDFIASLRKFASSGTNRAFIVPGNHDAALLFPALTNHLTQQFNSTRVSVVTSGYWLSDDSAIYADHGHQFDELNKMKNWPKPFVTSDGVERMQKPWGENMVQQFYNQYEFVFPVIDNVADEASGVSFAINDAGFNRTTSAVGKFFRFFLFEQSMRQTASVLSTDPAADPPKWDKAAVQKKPISFFVEGLQGDSKLTESATKAMASMDVQFDPTKLEDDEVKQICDLKLVLKGKGESIEQCPTTDGKLSSISNSIFSSPEKQMVKYLREVFARLSTDVIKKPNVYPSTYVFGHTHRAVNRTQLSLGDMKSGPVDIEYINTGAFQRIVSKEQLEKLLVAPAGGQARSLSSLTPNDLPACYTFVAVEPYSVAPKANLMSWVEGSSGKFAAGSGGCW